MSQIQTIGRDILIIDGRRYDFPRKKKVGHTVVQDGSRIYVDGYEWHGNGWRFTIRAFLKCLFI